MQSLKNTDEKKSFYFIDKKPKKQLIVAKFGGVCMANPQNIEKVIDVIKNDANRKIIVVSAPGQSNENDKKITDLLYECCESLENNKHNCNNNDYDNSSICDKVLLKIEKIFIEIIEHFKLNEATISNDVFNIKEIINICKNQNKFEINQKHIYCDNFKSFIASRGEFLMAKIMAEILNFEFVDAIDIIKFNNDGELDFIKTNKLIRNKLTKYKRRNLSPTSKKRRGVIVPGFYGQLPNGQILTFSRGGSDYTASLIAAAINADLYENWKDVDGLMSCDPKIVKSHLNIREITFNELRQLSYMGSKILHPDTVLPARKKNIPIVIKSIFEPEKQGTKIGNYINSKNVDMVKAITGKRNQVHLKIKKIMEYNEVEYFFQVFKILNDLNISSIQFDANVDFIDLFFNQNEIKCDEKEFIEHFKTLDFLEISLKKDVSLIAIVGEKIILNSQIFKRLFLCLNIKNIEVLYVKINSNGSNIIIAVENRHFENAIKIINKLLFLSKA